MSFHDAAKMSEYAVYRIHPAKGTLQDDVSDANFFGRKRSKQESPQALSHVYLA
jgi:hypothetical protein